MIPSFLPGETIDWDALKDQIASAIEQKKDTLREVQLKLDQSQADIRKMTQRNISITAHLSQFKGKVDPSSHADVQAAYESALDALQRLSVIRIQSEKLQCEKQYLNENISLLENIQRIYEEGQSSDTPTPSGTSALRVIEMLIQAQEGERQRLSRQMHDGPAQALSNFILQAEIAMKLFDIEEDQARAELENLRQTATMTFQKVRDFIFELRPMMLDDLGLVPTTKRYLEIVKADHKNDISLVVTGRERRLESYQEAMIFRAIQELIYNALRHSQANSIKVQMDLGETLLRITVDDDGKGFDPAILDNSTGMGLKVIRDRLNMVNGSCAVDSAPGHGTRILIECPAIERKTP